ncbi:MAG: tetratricopeptide repeat protein [Sphingomonadales bacterium]|nr:tetratricopeptide repeat protein [Sphingomonadales bacterium]
MPRGALRPQPTLAEPVVQPLPKREGMALDTALGRLARDPRDIDALIDAGNAALVMGDVDAATGFFRRADQVSPGNPRAKAGLAGAMVHNGDPFGAIPLFDEAEKAGALDTALAADRGLAYDLVGDNATAQRYYRQALARGANDEVVRRLALSLAISGDKPGAEATLSPLLQHRDLAAWRTRAFALAILGQTEEAVSIANTILPADLAGGIAPYLRYMPRLTHAQQAAAANFGSFPRASEIGRDDPRVADYAPKRGSVAAADTALMPQGEPFGRKARARDRDRSSRTQASERAPVLPAAAASPGTDQTKPARIAPPEPLPAREVASSPAARTPVAAAPAPARPPKPAPQLAMAAKPVSAPIQPRGGPPSAAAAPRSTVSDMLPVAPGFSLAPSAPLPSSAPVAAPASPPPAPPVSRPPAPVVQSPPPAPVRAPVAVAPSPAPVPRSLAEAFAEFNRPSTDATPAAGAVDLRRIKPTRPEAKKPAEPPKPPPPSHPSRIWVQLATGRDKAALGYDWRRMTREKAELLRGKAPFVSAWGQTNRLLTGPFQSEAAANSFIAQLRRADVDGAFVWTSPAGQVVDALAAAAPRH